MSNLSIEKLEHFFQMNQLHVVKYYTIKNSYQEECRYIELQTPYTVDTILMYVPEKYHINVSYKPNLVTLYPIAYTVKDDTDTIDQFIHSPDASILKNYGKVDVHSSIPTSFHKQAMSTHLDEMYNQTVTVYKDDDKMMMQNIYRQIRRLKYTLQGTQHNLAIFHQSFSGFLDGGKNIKMYESKEHIPLRQIYIVVDFNILHDKIVDIEQEVSHIYLSLYSILNNTQNTHIENLQRLMALHHNISATVEPIREQKEKYLRQLVQLRELLKVNQEQEYDIQREIEELTSLQIGNLQHDMQRGYKRDKLGKDLYKLKKRREEINSAIKDIIMANNHISLETDEILYDNIIMLDKIFGNLEKLKKN